MEPNWRELHDRLTRLTMKKLRPLGSRWFKGSLGGESRKAEYVDAMVSQMRYWWRSCSEQGGRDRVRNVMADLELAEQEVV